MYVPIRVHIKRCTYTWYTFIHACCVRFVFLGHGALGSCESPVCTLDHLLHLSFEPIFPRASVAGGTARYAKRLAHMHTRCWHHDVRQSYTGIYFEVCTHGTQVLVPGTYVRSPTDMKTREHQPPSGRHGDLKDTAGWCSLLADAVHVQNKIKIKKQTNDARKKRQSRSTRDE